MWMIIIHVHLHQTLDEVCKYILKLILYITSCLPEEQARERAVSLVLSVWASISALCSNKMDTVMAWPALAAKINGVHPEREWKKGNCKNKMKRKRERETSRQTKREKERQTDRQIRETDRQTIIQEKRYHFKPYCYSRHVHVHVHVLVP